MELLVGKEVPLTNSTPWSLSSLVEGDEGCNCPSDKLLCL